MENKIVFYNGKSGDEVAIYESEHGVVNSLVQFSEGVVVLTQKMEEVENNDSGMIISHGSDELDYQITVLDFDGKVVSNIKLEGVPELDIQGFLEFAYDGTKIYWQGNQSLCSYDLEQGKFEYVMDLNEVCIEKLTYLDNGKLAFYGCVMGEDDKLAYGFIDSKDIEYKVINGYHAGKILKSGNFACITDGINPLVGQDTSGKVIVMNGETGKCDLVSVDTFESMNSVVLDDGKYMISFIENGEGYRVRQYDLSSMKVVKESTIKTDERILDLYSTEDKKGCYVSFMDEQTKCSFEYVECAEE